MKSPLLGFVLSHDTPDFIHLAVFIAQAGHEVMILLPQPAKFLEPLHECQSTLLLLWILLRTWFMGVDVAWLVYGEHLTSIWEALGSIPKTRREKTKKIQGRAEVW